MRVYLNYKKLLVIFNGFPFGPLLFPSFSLIWIKHDGGVTEWTFSWSLSSVVGVRLVSFVCLSASTSPPLVHICARMTGRSLFALFFLYNQLSAVSDSSTPNLLRICQEHAVRIDKILLTNIPCAHTSLLVFHKNTDTELFTVFYRRFTVIFIYCNLYLL